MQFNRWLSSIEAACDRLAGLLVLVLAVIILVQALARHLFTAVPGVIEGAQLFLTAIAFLGLARAQAFYSHIRMDSVVTSLPRGTRRLVDLLVLAMSLAFFLVMTFLTGRNAFESWQIGDISMGYVPIPLWPSKMMVPLGCGLLCVRLAVQLVQRIVGGEKTDEGGTPVSAEAGVL